MLLTHDAPFARRVRAHTVCCLVWLAVPEVDAPAVLEERLGELLNMLRGDCVVKVARSGLTYYPPRWD